MSSINKVEEEQRKNKLIAHKEYQKFLSTQIREKLIEQKSKFIFSMNIVAKSPEVKRKEKSFLEQEEVQQSIN